MDIIRYVKNEEHYALLMDQVNKVKHTLWIGTADLKDLYRSEERRVGKEC